MKRKDSHGGAGVVVLLILAFIVVLILVGTCNVPNNSGVLPPSVKIDRVVGRYRNTDGMRVITITEAYEPKWNGRLSFFPAVGDWTDTLRCQVTGTDLAVEIPAGKNRERTAIRMFTLVGPDNITGNAAPWDGEYIRIR